MSDELYSAEVPIEWKIIKKFPMYEISTHMTVRNRKTGTHIPVDSLRGVRRVVLVKNITYGGVLAHFDEHFVEAYPSLKYLVR